MELKPGKVVIIGGGFAGLNAAKGLAGEEFEVTMLDRRNHHLFQPLLYQVATGGLSPADIAAPLREVLRKQGNTRVLLAEVVDFDPAGKRVILADGEVAYDHLLVAAGMVHSYFGHDDWMPLATGLKRVEEATEMRRRILIAFEAAERETDTARRSALLTFAIIGGGPTGVELAGALAELSRDTLRMDFRSFNPADAHILLLEGGDRLLKTFHPDLSAKAAMSLEKLGVEVHLNARVTGISPEGLEWTTQGKTSGLACRTILWAAGVKASPLGALLARRTGAETDPQGRVKVTPWLNLASHPEIFIAGDLACALDARGQPLPGVAPVAMQQGAYAARFLRNQARGKATPPFRYSDFGTLATIGRAAAVAEIGRFRFSGLFAWLLWLFIHLFHLIGFENRLIVLFQWSWNYFTRNRTALLITGKETAETRNLPLP